MLARWILGKEVWQLSATKIGLGTLYDSKKVADGDSDIVDSNVFAIRIGTSRIISYENYPS